MAELSDIALGIATVLQSTSQPEPLPVTLRGQSLDDGASLLRSIIKECADADMPLARVEADVELVRHMTGGTADVTFYSNVAIYSADDLQAELRFFRGA